MLIWKKNKHTRKSASVTVGLSVSATIKVRAAIYTRMFEIAKEHKDLAKSVSGKDRRAEIKESMVAILFAYTCLEAYINAIGSDRLYQDSFDVKDTPLDQKWRRVSQILSSRKLNKPNSVFNNKKEPFKSFLRLKEIREEYLVHWKAQSSEPVKTKYGLEHEPIATFNYDNAEWACNTVKLMVTVLNENMLDPPAISWLD